MQILGLLDRYFDAAVVFVKKNSLLFRLVRHYHHKVSKFQKQTFLISSEPKTERNYLLISALSAFIFLICLILEAKAELKI